MPPAAPVEDARLTPGRKSVYASGDFTVNTVLASLNIVYVFYFLTEIAGLRPELAGAVQFVGRMVDAFTDPAMGRLSDQCRWKWGRRRPFFLIAAGPFGVCFSMMWMIPSGSQLVMFSYYTCWYVLLSISMTVLSVPYLALQPEMATHYDARTSLNTYRTVGSLFGTIAATVTLRPVANALGGGPEGFAMAGVAFGVLIALPWLAVYRATWERPDFRARSSPMSLREGIGVLARHATFRKLAALYICGRISMDAVSAMLIVYFTHVIGRTEDFEVTMGLFFLTVIVALPIWLRVAPRFEKSTLFIIGSIWWATSFSLLLVAQPDWPRWILLLFVPLGAIGFAMVDLMPWAMLGEVVDEDDLRTGERREGIYNGFFMFLRKIGGTVAVFLLGAALGSLGLQPGEVASDSARLTIRLLTALVPAFFLGISIWVARGYPLTRQAHADILEQLEARRAER
ncbi:MAG: glycoside-pentoside-hexuronide (GPH):cation symporter [Myxococcota bacterium]